MKNKKDVIDLLHNADDSTIEKIVTSDPQYDRKKADRLYKQIERRVEGIDGDFTGGEVSGVEHYRPHRLRRAASMAACLAIVGAGVGTAFALRSGAPEDKSPASKISTGTVQTDESNHLLSHSEEITTEETSEAFINYSTPDVITQEWLLERCKNTENNFTRCYMETNENGMFVTKAADNKKGIKYYTTENSGRIDYVYGGKRISLFEQTKEVIENPVENMKSIRYDGPLDDLSKWTIEGREEYLGRDCAVIRVAVNPVSSQFDEAFETQWYIDLETGITLRIGVYDRESIQYTVETVKFLLDDEATMIPEPYNICMQIYLNGYTIEDGLDLSFLPKYPTNENGQTYGTDLGNPDNNVEPPDLQAVCGDHDLLGYCYTKDLYDLDNQPHNPQEAMEYMERNRGRHRVLNVYASDGKTIIDTLTSGNSSATETTTTATETTTTSEPATTNNVQSSDIFAMLDALDYHAISCDGLPTHKLTTPAGTVYALHLGETAQDSYVWRRPSLIADDDNEAPLTEEVFAAIYENWDSLDIVELNYKG